MGTNSVVNIFMICDTHLMIRWNTKKSTCILFIQWFNVSSNTISFLVVWYISWYNYMLWWVNSHNKLIL